MFDIVNTAFSYAREVIVCSFLQDFSTCSKAINLKCTYCVFTLSMFVGQSIFCAVMISLGGLKGKQRLNPLNNRNNNT